MGTTPDSWRVSTPSSGAPGSLGVSTKFSKIGRNFGRSIRALQELVTAKIVVSGASFNSELGSEARRIFDPLRTIYTLLDGSDLLWSPIQTYTNNPRKMGVISLAANLLRFGNKTDSAPNFVPHQL